MSYCLSDNQKELLKKHKGRKLSDGENRIATFLMNNQIDFIREHFFSDFTVKKRFKLLFYDFYIPKYRLCIEFDGIQHQTGRYMGKLQPKLKIHDQYKNQYCYRKGIKLLRIKHTDIDKIDDIICEYFDNHNL
jgi:very-short-patch-repair endonuclease